MIREVRLWRRTAKSAFRGHGNFMQARENSGGRMEANGDDVYEQ